MKNKHLRRGFKKEAEGYAVDLRKELNLQPTAPLDPWKLAAKLEIPVIPLSRFAREHPDATAHFQNGTGRSALSAFTILIRTWRMIVHNDYHAHTRQVNNLAHELAHGILDHPPGPPLSDNGCRNYDPRLEAEANWLGPTLLVPRDAAVTIALRQTPIPQAAALFGVSEKLLKMRLGVTGATKIASRTRRRRQN